jgi:hypothetical protein
MPDSERNPGMQVLTCSEFVIRVGRGVSSERIKTSAVPSAFGLGYAKSIGIDESILLSIFGASADQECV